MSLAMRRSEEEARAQLDRWKACDDKEKAAGPAIRTLVERANEALGYDYWLILALASTLLTGSLLMRRQTRWRFAGEVGIALTLAYAAVDVRENVLLRRFLDDQDRWTVLLPILSAVKFGALVASLPLVGGALFVFVFREPPDYDLASGSRPKSRFWLRWRRRLKGLPGPRPVGVDHPVNDPRPVRRPGWVRRAWRAVLSCLRALLCRSAQAREDPAKPESATAASHHTTEGSGLGVCCSGGGIRSAAFSLGALQALDEQPKGESELSKASWLFSVSGGSYLSAAWVTARARRQEAWTRGSFEETHLRRHAAYLAPGLGGKAWAVLWYFLALIANVGLLVITIGAFFLPVGWLIATGIEHQPVESGVVSLPEGGCIELAEGPRLSALPGTSLRLTEGARVRAADGAVVTLRKEVQEATATATAEGPPPVRAVAIVGGTTTTTTTTVPGHTAEPAPSCDASPEAGPAAGMLRGDAAGRVFKHGTQVPIAPGPKVEVRSGSERVAGCIDLAPGAACLADAAGEHVVAAGSRLLGAPSAQLTLDTKAIVGDRPGRRLDQACGVDPCDRFRLHKWLSWLPATALGMVALMGLALVTMREEPDARASVQKWTRLVAVGASLITVSLWAIPQLVLSIGRGRSWLEDQAGVVGGVSGGTVLLALLTQLRAASAKSDKPGGKVADLIKGLGGRLRPLLLRLASVVAGPVLLLLTAVLFASYGASFDADFRQITLAVAMAGLLAVFGACADLNRWSLHPYYRERLRSAFAAEPNGEWRNEDLADLRTGTGGPELTLCGTANLADDRVTPPGRPALPWTFSKQDMGSCPGTGCYVPTTIPTRFGYLTKVWTSVAVSGAAFAPAMGKMSRSERFLMTLGNLRLGLWYPNPIYFQQDRAPDSDFDPDWYEWHHPRLWYLFKEAFGLHKLRDPWVYVTDGGHYENLGLVELLRTKRCREVYCFDASGDSTHTFGTLADAQRLARQEWQIEIDLDPRGMASDKNGVSKVGVWAGTVGFPEGRPGWLVVAKLAVPLSAPFDIVDTARTLPSFPTHPTADQLYTDQKFEAYRALGHHLGQEALAVGTLLRRLVAGGIPVQEAVSHANDQLCQTRDGHPCPPPKADGKAAKEEPGG
ncbi:MAG: hypothetical protein ACR2KK_15550 [Acidimicrobiales bacterium]